MALTLIASNLIDLRLQVVYHLRWHRIAKNVEQIDALVAGYLLVGAQLDALLHVLDLGILGYEQRLLRLSYGLVRVGGALTGLWQAAHAASQQQHGQHGAQREEFHFGY